MRLPWTRKPKGEYRFAALAQYNTEKGRGIVHTEMWRRIMKEEQAKFNRAQDKDKLG